MEVDNTNAGFATARGLKGQSAQDIIKNRKARNTPRAAMVFPSGLGVHCTLMRFFDYSYGGTSGSKQKAIADIVLPLPRQIQDSFKVNIAGDELGILGDTAAQASSGPENINKIAQQLGGATVKSLVGMGKDLANGDYAGALGLGADAGQFLVRAGLGKIAPDIANGISAGRGTAINPFATLVFKGVDLKVHSLEWLLSPESEEDSRKLKTIIKTMQQMVLPKVDSALGQDSGINAIDRGILRYPAMVDVYFQGIDMNYYFKFKTSMISQFNVDYTPNGLSINKGGRPSAIRVTMTLQEAYIHTSQDYDDESIDIENQAEMNNEASIRRSLGLIDNPEAGYTSPDSVDNSGSGAQKSVLGVGSAPGGVTVKTPDGQSSASATTSAGLADEVAVGGVTYTINQLVARGVDRATILANPSVYVPSQV
jgi:hypothetical protein